VKAKNEIKKFLWNLRENKVRAHVRDDFGVGSENARNSAAKMRSMSDMFERKTG
jgi:hypothetical protein